MTAQALLTTIKNRGIELKAENGRIFARPSLPENLRGAVKTFRVEIMALLGSTPSDLALSQAYRQYWTTPESAPMETFTAILAEIGTLEGQLDPSRAIATLEQSAQSFHRETGICPYCRLVGPLHHGTEGHEG
jgi:hypothetical protein